MIDLAPVNMAIAIIAIVASGIRFFVPKDNFEPGKVFVTIFLIWAFAILLMIALSIGFSSFR